MAEHVAYLKFLQEADHVELRAGFGEYGRLFTLEDKKMLEKWAAQTMGYGVGASEDPQAIRELNLISVMCELNRGAQRKAAQTVAEVSTKYKKVSEKIRPVDDPKEKDEDMEFGREDWKIVAKENQLLKLSIRERVDLGPFDHLFEKRYASFPRGSRLTAKRMQEQKFGPDLSAAERTLFQEMILNREAAIAFNFGESGRITRDVSPPYRIKTIPHKAWQIRSFPVAKAVEEEFVQMLEERLDRGTLERCNSPYRNPYFLVAKKDGKHRLVQNAVHMNKVSRRDANLPPTADEFSEKFAGCKILSLMDMFSGYDQITLHPDSRDMTAIHTPIGLLRSCTMVQGATNSVAAFQRIMMKILRDHSPHTMPFIDDVTAGGPKTDYGGEEALPGVRRFVLEHVQQLDQVLADIERAGGTVSGKKCYWGMARLGVVGYEVSFEGRYPDRMKVEKIVKWPECRNVKEVRMFVGICVYYRIWVPSFAIRAKPLFILLRGDTRWTWEEPQRVAMKELKHFITTAPALMTINYKTGGTVYLAVDASGEGAGASLEQIGPDGRRHPCRFESTVWSKSEAKWHSTKLECRAVLWALKKFRVWLYGTPFVIETDAQTLIAQLNRSSSEIPGGVMNRWLAAILAWDFEIQHVPGKRNVVADALSRYPKEDGWEPPDETEDDVEDFIEHMIANVESYNPTKDKVLRPEYGAESEGIARFLVRFEIPDVPRKELRAWKKRALNFFVRDGFLFRKTSQNIAVRRVVDDEDVRIAAIWEIHRLVGHRGVNAVYSMMAQRYWWERMYETVKLTLRTCHECQKRSSKKKVDMLTNTYSHALWEMVAIDVVYMPHDSGKRFLVIARDYLSGWPEARALPNNRSKTIAKFIYEDILCRWSMARRIVVDGGPDFQKVVRDLATVYGIRRVQISAHNPQANGKIEGGHKPIVNALAKLRGSWVSNLPTVLLADRISIQENTGYSAYQLVTGQNPVLPIELALPTWQTLPFRQITDRAQLLAVRAAQVDLRDQFIKDAVSRIERLRLQKKEYWDDHKEIRREEISPGSLVLLWDSVRQTDMSRDRKLSDKWLGPYLVARSFPESGTYQLKDLDGAEFAHTTPGWRVKIFYQRSQDEVNQEDRGLIKLWDRALWENRHIFRAPPAQFDESGIEGREENEEAESENRDQEILRPDVGGPTLEIRPRTLSDKERAEYRYFDISDSSESDQEEDNQ